MSSSGFALNVDRLTSCHWKYTYETMWVNFQVKGKWNERDK